MGKGGSEVPTEANVKFPGIQESVDEGPHHPVVTRAQWEVVTRSGSFAFVISSVVQVVGVLVVIPVPQLEENPLVIRSQTRRYAAPFLP